MRAIMLMFDSLNRRLLAPYGCDWTHTPNFARLAERTVTFDRAYVGSMPCMPARRELHTGRYNFLHRSWGPLEPFDFSAVETLKNKGIYTHLASDHYHYWEDGGATFQGRYNSHEFFRGQECDGWKGVVAEPELPEGLPWNARYAPVFYRNRPYLEPEENHNHHKTISAGLEFLETNKDEQGWFLHIECFDPHEPWLSPDHYKALYTDKEFRPGLECAPYWDNKNSPEEVEQLRILNAALVSMCDASVGKVLDMMDEHDMWQDTLLIVNTDHGYLLGEHDQWGKCVQPFYDEVAHTPMFIWDPRCGRRGEHCDCLVQTIDLPATLLEFFSVDRPPTMQGVPLRETIASDKPVRDAALFGIHGGQVNVVDDRYVYMRAPVRPSNTPLYNYTLMPTHMRGFFENWELKDATLAEPFTFTEGCPTLRCPATWGADAHAFGTNLFDMQRDPAQMAPINDAAIEERMAGKMARLMRENDAPLEQFDRLGLPES